MTIEEKLKHFEEASMERARNRSLEIIREHQAALEQIEREHRETKLRQADLQIQTETENLKHQINMAVSREQLQIKRRLTTQQNELKDKLFVEVAEKLKAYRKTKQYQTLLSSQIQRILETAGEQSVTIYIDPEDAALKESLEADLKASLTISAYSFLGGTRAILPDRHILIDHSFATRLEEEKEAFSFDGGTSHE